MEKKEVIKLKSPNKKLGRPSTYNEEIGLKICNLVATNICGIEELCKKFPEIPSEGQIRQWRFSNDSFHAAYAKAKVFQAELIAETVLLNASLKQYYTDAEGNQRVDGGFTNSQRLLIDTMKWIACKLVPRVYGDKVVQETSMVVRHEDALKELE